MNINSTNLFGQSAPAQIKQSTGAVSAPLYNKQVAFSGNSLATASMASKGVGKKIISSLAAGLVALTVAGGVIACKNKNIQLNDENGGLTHALTDPAGEGYDISLTSNNPTGDTSNFDMAIKTKSGNIVHMHEFITQNKDGQPIVNYEFPKHNYGDVGLSFTKNEITGEVPNGDLVIDTKSGSKLKFPWSLKLNQAKQPILKLDSVNVADIAKKLVRNR